MLLVAHCMPQVSSYIAAYPSFFCLLTVLQQQIFLYLLFSASITDKCLNIHLCAYLCLSSEPTLVLESLPGSTTHGKQTAPAERVRREGERERGKRERKCDEQMQMQTQVQGDLAVCKLDDEREEWRRKKGRGGATLSCTGMKMTQGQYSQNHLFSEAPSLPIHQQRGERGHCIHGNGRTAVGSSQEARWGAVACSSLSVWLSDIWAHLSADCTDVLQPLMCGRTGETKNIDGSDDASRVFEAPLTMTLVMLKFYFLFFHKGKINQQAGSIR